MNYMIFNILSKQQQIIKLCCTVLLGCKYIKYYLKNQIKKHVLKHVFCFFGIARPEYSTMKAIYPFRLPAIKLHRVLDI